MYFNVEITMGPGPGLKYLQGPCARSRGNSGHTVTKSWLRGHHQRTRPCFTHSVLMAVAPAQLSWGGCSSGCPWGHRCTCTAHSAAPLNLQQPLPSHPGPAGVSTRGKDRREGGGQSTVPAGADPRGGILLLVNPGRVQGRRKIRPRRSKSRRSLNTHLHMEVSCVQGSWACGTMTGKMPPVAIRWGHPEKENKTPTQNKNKCYSGKFKLAN